MAKFMAWLADEAKGYKAILGYVIFAAIIVVSLDYAVESALINWHFMAAPPLPQEGETPFKYINVFGFINLFGWGPMKEEVLFRVLPLSIVIAFVSTAPRVVFGFMAAFAILFGAIHPYAAIGDVQVAVAGFFFGLVFLKCGGMNKAFIKASACAVAAHGLSNALTVLDAWWRYFELKL